MKKEKKQNMVFDLINEFSSTWASLDAYDKGSLEVVDSTKIDKEFEAAISEPKATRRKKIKWRR